MSIVIITGASRGIGAATARQAAKRGMGVIVTYNSHAAGADDVVGSIKAEGGKAIALKLDVAKVGTFPAFAKAVATALKSTWGRDHFDALVNNAGYGLFNPRP
jgi:NAD(P)-dependent dehydrogenase (short-subunit alcohol dehydrogenase family)